MVSGCLRLGRGYLEVAIGGSDVEGGEAVVERCAAGEGRVGGEERAQGVEVPELRRAEVVVLVAGAGAAHAVPHGCPSTDYFRGGGSSGSTPPAVGKVVGGGGRRAPKRAAMGKERRWLYAFLLLR